jgi:carboxymethylenebutenolidase
LFHRVGSPEIAYDNFPEAMTAMASLDASGIGFDLGGAVSFLADAGYSSASIGVVGYCMGGTVSFYAATLGLVGAAATFYGGGIESGRFGFAPLVELAPRLRCAWIGFYGDRDKGIPSEQVEALRAAVSATPFDTDVVRYPSADHAFHCDARPDVYDADAATDAHRRTLAFLDEHLREK